MYILQVLQYRDIGALNGPQASGLILKSSFENRAERFSGHLWFSLYSVGVGIFGLKSAVKHLYLSRGSRMLR